MFIKFLDKKLRKCSLTPMPTVFILGTVLYIFISMVPLSYTVALCYL